MSYLAVTRNWLALFTDSTNEVSVRGAALNREERRWGSTPAGRGKARFKGKM